MTEANIAVSEALLVFALIEAYIWKLRFTHPLFWIVPAALILASHLARRERAAELGFRFRNFGVCVRRYGPALVVVIVTVWLAGLLRGTIRALAFLPATETLSLYLPWGLAQQYLINGYFLRRLESRFPENTARVLAAALFCAAHAPNGLLMTVTPVAAYAAIGVYRRYGNLYFLGIAHALIGFALFMAVPDSVSHHLCVGPGWFAWRPHAD